MSEDKKVGIVCRVCLNYNSDTESGKGISLFEEYNDCIISDQINAITNVGIREGDGLPDRICPTCLLELQSAYNFKQKCENTNEILLSAANNVTTNIENLDVTLPMKEEYLEDEYDSIDDNISLADWQADTDVKPHNEPPCKPSRAIDLKLECKYDSMDDNISLADWQADTDVKPPIDPPCKPSRAIDLKLECHDCGGSFKSKCKLRVHWKRVHLADSLKCSKCLRKFKTFAAYKSHRTKNLQSCATAGKVRIEGEGRNRVFHCKDCNYKSVRIKDVSAHIIIHSGERPYQCDICLKSFTQLSSVTAHRENVHKICINEATCDYCGKHFQGRSKLYKHLRSHKYDSFPCKICKSVLKTREGLRNHMKRHSGIKAYACEMCPTAFYTSSELYNHRTKVHLKLKYYVCQLCNYKTASHGTMSRHKAKHSDSDFVCNICGCFLENEQQLALHKKKHTDRHYQCPNCGKKYYTRKNLLSHIRKIHKIVKLNDRRLETRSKVSSIKSESAKEIQP